MLERHLENIRVHHDASGMLLVPSELQYRDMRRSGEQIDPSKDLQEVHVFRELTAQENKRLMKVTTTEDVVKATRYFPDLATHGISWPPENRSSGFEEG